MDRQAKKERWMNMVLLGYMGFTSIILIICSGIMRAGDTPKNTTIANSLIILALGLIVWTMPLAIILLQGKTVFDLLRYTPQDGDNKCL